MNVSRHAVRGRAGRRPAKPLRAGARDARAFALSVVAAISAHLDSEDDEAIFFGSLSETVAQLVGARRAAFWRLDENDVMSIQPDPHGFTSSRVLELKVPLQRAGRTIPEQVVFRDRVDRGHLRRADRDQFHQSLEYLGVRNAAAVSWRAGGTVLGGLAAYDSDTGFSDTDVWALRLAAATSASVWLARARRLELERARTRLERVMIAYERLRTLTLQAGEVARRDLARQLHDDALQALTAADIQLKRLRTRLGEGGSAELLSAADEAAEMVRMADGNLRRLLFDLRPSAFEVAGSLESAVRDYASWVANAARIECDVDLAVRDDVPPTVRTNVYRVIQGALNNVETHSGARHVRISVESRHNGVHGFVEDDGSGFDIEAAAPQPGHLGLVSMRERAELSGGWLRLSSTPGSGTRVEFWVPEEPFS